MTISLPYNDYQAALELVDVLRLPENADVLARFVTWTPEGHTDIFGKPISYPFSVHLGLLLSKYNAIVAAIVAKHGIDHRVFGGIATAARHILDGQPEQVQTHGTKP